MKIPFVDLQAQYKSIRQDVLKGVEAVFDKCNFVLGDEVAKFEADFARYCGSDHGVGVANGTDALHLAVRALGIGAGDEVLVPANTFIATALGVTFAGAKPIPVDVDASTFLMNPMLIEKAITPRTKAIMPVHLYGRMMDLDPVLEIARKHKLAVIEDTAQAHGAELRGKRAGTRGVMGCFSFYPGKNLGCYGDGGLITTNDAELKEKLEALRNYGSKKKYHHPIVGYNSRLDTVQAAVLNAKLPHLNAWSAARASAAVKYNKAIEGIGDLILPQIPDKGSHVFHLYVLRTKKRDALLAHLNANGVQAGIHYPTPIHLHGAYADLGYRKGSFPVSEQLCDEIVSLPMFPEISDEQIHYVVGQLKGFF
ncbi:MAG: DegT/DnrJ/EryC1/StrS family aminotransferase [Deltaproteobacteria bacterium]|nr:DegT/DnrJ/EryC1/StrS family aminotransferase [Deltaproteobacteria bacterium]